MSGKYFGAIALGVIATLLYIAALGADVYGIASITYNFPGAPDQPDFWAGFRQIRDEDGDNRSDYNCGDSPNKSNCEGVQDAAATAFAFGLLGLVSIFSGTVMIGLKKPGGLVASALSTVFSLIGFAVWFGLGQESFENVFESLAAGAPVTVETTPGYSSILLVVIFIFSLISTGILFVFRKGGEVTL